MIIFLFRNWTLENLMLIKVTLKGYRFKHFACKNINKTQENESINTFFPLALGYPPVGSICLIE